MMELVTSLLVLILFTAHIARGAFIQPQTQISNLSLWATIHTDQICQGNCYNSFHNISCKDSRVCSEDNCTGRVGLPPIEHPLQSWSLNGSRDGCSVKGKDTASSPPTVFVADSDDRMLIVNGSSGLITPCYTQRNSSVDGDFTLVFWLMADCSNCSVLSLLLGNQETFHVRVISNQICVNTSCQAQPSPDKQWVMIGARVVERRLTVFINNASMEYSTVLESAVLNIHIGSYERPQITDIFRLFYVRYYRDALTKREIETLRTGLTDPTIHFEDCQCPIHYLDEVANNNCTNGESYYPRYIPAQFYNASVTIDEDPNTYWASLDQGDVLLTLNFSVSFQIEIIRIMFDSNLPYRVLYSLFSGGQQNSSHAFECTNRTCTANMPSLGEKSLLSDFDAQRADTIKIELHRQTPQEIYNFVITAIDITGRCDCNGNADSCTLNPESKTYSCSCKPETHTLGQHCEMCSANYSHLVDQFDCPLNCHCNKDGVADVSKPCEEEYGRCECKQNVEGEACDRCKPFSYHFDASLADGCEVCNCNQNGSVSCSENGSCICEANTKPPFCDQCLQYSYGFNTTQGCQLCSCNQAGTIDKNRSCDEVTGQCLCKANVQGQRCDSCKLGYYSMETANQQGCKTCGCHPVGSEYNQCDVTGQCQCRGGIRINKNCIPEITSIDPTYGPNVGGTLVTIYGNLLGNKSESLAVFLNDTQQDLVLVTDTMVMFKTMPYNAMSHLAPELKLSWKEDSTPVKTQTQFSYQGNPTINNTMAQNVTTFVSGGCQVKIYGTDLQSVKYPKLEVALLSKPTNKMVANCRHTKDYVICPTPDLKSLYTSPDDRFIMTAVFDGVTSSNIGSIDVKPDPGVRNADTIDFQYPFEDTITLKGTGLRAACQEHEMKVFTGSVSCAIVHITDTEIECKPSVSPPGGYKDLPIQVNVGNIHWQVGTLHYLELRETTGFIAIISSVAAAIGVAIIVIIACYIWHRRRKKAAGQQITTNNDETPKDVSELTKPTEEPTIYLNSQDVAVLKETVFREPKKGIVNTEAEDAVFNDEFLPKVDASLKDDLKQCYIGSGHFVLGRHCALKEPQLPFWGNLALSECFRLRHCKHAHVLSILGVGIRDNHFHIFYPRMSQYILKTLICDNSKELSIRQLLSFGQQVAEGIIFLVSKDITHKDIAARNCMVDESLTVKLGDAAFSWDYFENEYVYDEQRERYLPLRWMAPESIQDGYYDMRTDVWSFAIFVWELLTRGCLPYHEASSSQEVSNYITQGYILGKPDILSDKVYDMMCNCWSQENEQRPNISAVSKTLSDILETEDDGIYANVGEATAHVMQNSQKNSVKLRQSPGGGHDSTFRTSRLSKA